MKVRCIKNIEGFNLDQIYYVSIADVYLYYIDDYWVKKIYFEDISYIRGYEVI